MTGFGRRTASSESQSRLGAVRTTINDHVIIIVHRVERADDCAPAAKIYQCILPCYPPSCVCWTRETRHAPSLRAQTRVARRHFRMSKIALLGCASPSVDDHALVGRRRATASFADTTTAVPFFLRLLASIHHCGLAAGVFCRRWLAASTL